MPSSFAQSEPAIDPLELAMLVDTYAAWQTGGLGTRSTLSGHRGFSGQGSSFAPRTAYLSRSSGVDASYDTGKYGALVNLRLGQAASIFHFHSKADTEDDAYGKAWFESVLGVVVTTRTMTQVKDEPDELEGVREGYDHGRRS